MRRQQTEASVEQIERSGENGDWLVIRGYKFTDHLVATVTNAPFSHVGILDLDGGQVVEAEERGVHGTKLWDFVHKSHRVRLIRPVWAEGEAGARAIVEARRLIGRDYDFLGTIGFGSRKRFYCSELVVHVYGAAQSDGEPIPAVIEPTELCRWGDVLYDSGVRTAGRHRPDLVSPGRP